MSHDAIAALHLAARRYCEDNSRRWAEAYGELRATRGGGGALVYSDDDYRTFPRYNVLNAILEAIETWVPEEVATVEEARQRLVVAARTAASPFTASDHPIERATIAEERRGFEQFATTSTAEDWARAEPLPFRRVLAAATAAVLLAAFRERWGTWYGGHGDRDDVPPFVTLHVEAWAALPLRPAVEAALAELGCQRVIELREDGRGQEIDATAATLAYRGDEAIWLVPGGDWMIYASHESSITFGGAALVAALRARVPRLDELTYHGWQDPPSARGIR